MTILASLIERAEKAIPILPVTASGYAEWLPQATPAHRAWLAATGFTAAPGKLALVPDSDGTIALALYGVTDVAERWAFAALPGLLPAGQYCLEGLDDPTAASRAALAFALGLYRFDRYKKAAKPAAELVWPDKADRAEVTAATEAIALVRDLINIPANDLGPAELAAAAQALAARCGAEYREIVGDELLQQNYPAIHMVGVGSPRAPRLIDLRWGDPAHPALTLVGKGVVFDTGGLDIKPSSAMNTMKKDMGGAAHALGLAQMIMALGLKVRLRVLVPAVENSVSGRAMRPGDIMTTRAGLTVEVGNTDAEGRLVLADALAEACTEKPQAIIDFATLTGAARVALGPELPAMFCNDEPTAAALIAAGERQQDPFWRLPLWQTYAANMEGKISDLNNDSGSSFAGAIHAALFMEKFIQPGQAWVHFDVFGWNPTARPARPFGGEAFVLHACLEYVREVASR
jgi:leucyl aminopeptidase